MVTSRHGLADAVDRPTEPPDAPAEFAGWPLAVCAVAGLAGLAAGTEPPPHAVVNTAIPEPMAIMSPARHLPRTVFSALSSSPSYRWQRQAAPAGSSCQRRHRHPAGMTVPDTMPGSPQDPAATGAASLTVLLSDCGALQDSIPSQAAKDRRSSFGRGSARAIARTVSRTIGWMRTSCGATRRPALYAARGAPTVARHSHPRASAIRYWPAPRRRHSPQVPWRVLHGRGMESVRHRPAR